MPVHNGEKYIVDAVRSVLQQTFREFEFIIVNDGSLDSTADILESFRREDNRVAVYHQEKLGFTEALNRACGVAKGKYIARMDADDISLPQRFNRQVEFLEANPKYSVCGTWIKTLGSVNDHIIQYPTSSEYIKCRLLFDCVLAHPSVMMARDLFEKHGLSYNSQFREASDYFLWVGASKAGALVNIPEVLLLYRVHTHQVSVRDHDQQQQFGDKIRLLQIKELEIKADLHELDLHKAISTKRFLASKEFVERSEIWLRKLQAANSNVKKYDEPTFSRVLAEYWFSTCNAATELGLWTFRRFSNSPFSKDQNLSSDQKLKLLAKCIVRRSSC